MSHVNITPSHRALREFYSHRELLAAQAVTNEQTVREPFKNLLNTTAAGARWTLLVENKLPGKRATPDGTLKDEYLIPRGYWEAKDTRDNLEVEIVKKFDKGYPKNNIIFEDTRRAILYQSQQRVGEFDLTKADEVADLLTRFLSYTAPNIEQFEEAVDHFKTVTPTLAAGLLERIADAHKSNKAFQSAFADFMELCKTALNPNISQDAINEMLIQHLLTERLMRTIFDNPEFAQRNAIANEIEKVITALTSKNLNRREFLGKLDGFYNAIEEAAKDLRGFTEKQHFINTVYERFFQGYAVKVADTHGIVYTPQPIVDFMCAAVQEVLRDEFGYGLDHPEVCIIDPCTGTGNFIINLLHRIHQHNPAALPDVYAKRLFANEVMLLPYYVASLNIEHAYYELAGAYAPFEGLCFVDTLDLAEGAQMKLGFMTERNSERVERQKQAKITVILGNPPYNMGQVNENDNNQNRTYEVIDGRVYETYAKDSRATLNRALYDPYVKFFRWASDRLQGRDGIVCYVSNNSFVDRRAFDGMRKHLLQDFTRVYHLDMHGNIQQNPKLSGTTHNVFGIQVGVGVTVAVRSSAHTDHKLFYHRLPELWRKEEKLAYLEEMVEIKGRHNSLNTVAWEELTPDDKGNWLVPEHAEQFDSFIPMGSKETRASRKEDVEAIFKMYSLGVSTNRDSVVYNFGRQELETLIDQFGDNYNAEVNRYRLKGRGQDVDDFLDYSKVKWSRNLKRHLTSGDELIYDPKHIRKTLYRPFTRNYLYFADLAVDESGVFPDFLPTATTEQENLIIGLTDLGSEKPFMTLISNSIVDLHLVGAGSGTQCFPFYVYDEDGGNRRENITDWALAQFRARYTDESLSKWDIFYYVYALLHHPAYRARYADNLKKSLPRIPFASDFRALAEAGKRLADLHLHYESAEPYALEHQWKTGKPVSYRVEKMRLSKDKSTLTVNDSLTLAGIPPEAYQYRLGNRSALEWVIDQYQIKTDKSGKISSDPNAYSDDEDYIVKLVGRVITVSLATAQVIEGLGEI